MGEKPNSSRKLYVAVVGAGPVGLVCAAKLALSLGQNVNIEVYERRIDWNNDRGCYEWISEDQGNRRREQVVTLQDDVIDLLTHKDVHRLFDGERVWRTSRNVAIRDLEDRLLDFCQQLSSVSNIRFARLPEVLHDCQGRVHPKKFGVWVNGLDVDMVIGADGANSLTRSSFGIPHVALGSTDERSLKHTDFALGIGLTAEGVDGGQRQALNGALTLAQNRYLLNSEHGKRGYLNIRLTPDEYGILAEHNGQGSCGFANPINLYNLYREPETEGAMPLVDGVPKIEEIITEGLNLYNLSWRHVNSVVGIQITPTYAEQFYHLEKQSTQRPKHVFLVGDAAMSHHFWPGRGLNTGLKSAVAATDAIERFVQTEKSEYLHRFELFMTLLRFREMQGRSASMLRKDNSLPHWLDEIENLSANHKPSEKSLTRVLLDQTSKNADALREQFLKNVLAWNTFNENSEGWPHKAGAVTEEMIRRLVYTSQTRPKLLTLRAMVDSAVRNNSRRAGWPIHQQRGIGEFMTEMSPTGWWVGAEETMPGDDSMDDVKKSVLQLMYELSTREGSQTEKLKTRLKLCGIDVGFDSVPGLKYDSLMQEGMEIIEKADYQLPTVFVLGNTGAGKSTSIAFLRGDPLIPKYEETEDRHSLIPGKGYAGPEIGGTKVSVTCFPVSYPITTPHGTMNVCDTAGFFESRGALHEAVGMGLVQYVFGTAQKPTGFIVVCEYSEFDAARGRILENTLNLFAKIFPGEQSLDPEAGGQARTLPAPDVNFVLLVSKTHPGYKPTSLRKMIEDRVDAIDKTECCGENDNSHRQYLQFLLDHGNLATYGTDNAIHFLPRGHVEEQDVGGVSEMLSLLGSWEAFAKTRFGNLSTLGANARNFLGSLVLREATKMSDVVAQARDLVCQWESLDTQITTFHHELARHQRDTDTFTERSQAIQKLLSEGSELHEARKKEIDDLTERLKDLEKDYEVVVWEQTERWKRGVSGDTREIKFDQDGVKIHDVREDLSPHIIKVKGGLTDNGRIYAGTFRRKKTLTQGSCTVTITSLYRDLPFVVHARRQVEAMLDMLNDMQTSWKAQKAFLEGQLEEADKYVEQTEEIIANRESEVQRRQTELGELTDKLGTVRSKLSLSPKYESFVSLYHKLCDSEGLSADFPSDLSERIRVLRGVIDEHLETSASN